MRRRWNWLPNASPAELFLIGGEELSTVYPQPEEVRDSSIWTICIPYGMGEAAVEGMQNQGKMDLRVRATPEIVADREIRIAEITRSVIRAAEIEAARRQLADTINQIYFNR